MATATKKGSKAAKVKWAIGGVEPEDLPDFKDNSEIGLPPKGVYNFLVKKVTRKDNKNGDPMLTVTLEIKEKSKEKKKYNGYTCWERLNVTEQGAPYLKRWLTSMGVTWKEFINNTVVDETTDPETLVSIGSVKFGTKKDVMVRAATRYRDYEGEDQLDVARFLPPAEEESETEEVEDEEELEEDEIEIEEEEEEEEDEEAEDDEDEEELREELSELTPLKLKKRAIAAGADSDDLPSKKSDIIDLIVELELGEEEEDEEDEEEEEVDEDELREELDELGLPELRARAKSNGAKIADVKGKKKSELIDLIVELEVVPF